jgi:homoserine kinase type II
VTDTTSLLAEWGLPADARLAAAEHGTNNQTIIVSAGSHRFVLRISQNLTSTQVRAEHRLLARLRGAGLPFAVPEPWRTLAGKDLVETSAGPATLTAWLPGVRPNVSGDAALRRIGRTVGLLSRALAPAPPQDAPHNWQSAAHVHPDVPDVGELCGDLRAAGADPNLARLLETLAAEVDGSPVTGLPVQVVHGDLAASNLLADERTGEITAVLDFEIAGLDDPGARLYERSEAVRSPGRARLAAAGRGDGRGIRRRAGDDWCRGGSSARSAERGLGRLGALAGWPVAARAGSIGRGHGPAADT